MYAERIKEVRKTLNLSVAKLSDKIDIPSRTIVSYESGRDPSLEFLAKLSKNLNINANWFLTGEGEMFNQNAQQYAAVQKDLRSEVLQILKEEGIIK